MKATKKTEERLKTVLPKFQKVLGIAKSRDINESDTVSVINDMLSDVFGWEKYSEITSELAIRGTYCDLALRIGDKFEYLIEVKAIGLDLKEMHLRQAIGYGANKGIQWIVLTNGIQWDIYRLRFEQPIQWDVVARINMENVNTKSDSDFEKLLLLTKEGVEKNAREELYEKTQCINRYVVSQMILSETCVSLLRRELKKLSEGINVEEEEVKSIITNYCLRREVLDPESDDVNKAINRVNKFYKAVAKSKLTSKPAPKQDKEEEKKVEAKPTSVTDMLLASADDEKVEQHIEQMADEMMNK